MSDEFHRPYQHLLFAQKSGTRRLVDFVSAIVVCGFIAIAVAFVVHGVYDLVSK